MECLFNYFYSELRYNKILIPMISNIDTITRIPPSPPNPNSMLSLICMYGIAEEINKWSRVLTDKIDLMNKGESNFRYISYTRSKTSFNVILFFSF